MPKPTNEEVLASVKTTVAIRISSIGVIMSEPCGRDLCDANDLCVYLRSEGHEIVVESAMGHLLGRFKIVPA